jgi:hypothetical protein
VPNYRRAFVPGGCWFFTANLRDRRSSLRRDQIEALREATRRANERRPFHIDAFVVLPGHIDVAAGLLPQDWAGGFDTLGEFGEREWRNQAIAPYALAAADRLVE